MTNEDKQAAAFSLPYFINFKAFYVDAYLTRRVDRYGETIVECFRLSDDALLGSGTAETVEESKRDAQFEAQYNYPRKFDLVNA